jgi:hypothetical protein
MLFQGFNKVPRIMECPFGNTVVVAKAHNKYLQRKSSSR